MLSSEHFEEFSPLGVLFLCFFPWRFIVEVNRLTVNSRFFDSPPRVPYNIIIYIYFFL